MHILMIHNRYLERGGEDETVESETNLLREHGHQVDVLVRDNREILRSSRWVTAVGAIWSASSARMVTAALRKQHYDVMHVQNFFPLFSPSILYAARRLGVPVVLSLHNYRLLCVNGLLYRGEEVCTRCVRKPIPWPAIWYGCYRGSRAGSAAVVGMQLVHRALGTWHNQVDVFVTFSQFARTLLVQSGMPAERLVVRPHFVAPDPGEGPDVRHHVLYVGRLTVGKGIRDLLTAWERIDSPWPLHVIGDGPLAPEVKQWASEHSNIKYLGRLSRHEVYAQMRQAWLLVLPSRYFETFGRVVVEAFATGTPVVVPAHGALAELITPGQTGMLVEAGNHHSLTTVLQTLLAQPAHLRIMGRKARRVYEQRFTAEQGYLHLMEIYQQARALRPPAKP